jgi:predicted DNA binding CopG/RHH family protein
VSERKPLSMVLPVELIEAIKLRSGALGLSITAYVSALVRSDLAQRNRSN